LSDGTVGASGDSNKSVFPFSGCFDGLGEQFRPTETYTVNAVIELADEPVLIISRCEGPDIGVGFAPIGMLFHNIGTFYPFRVDGSVEEKQQEQTQKALLGDGAKKRTRCFGEKENFLVRVSE